jgi:UDP-glucoronosyl and UDP-glucosyl transferase
MPPRVAVFCAPEPGHFQLLRPLIAGLVRRGVDVRVYTDREYSEQVREVGAVFEDLFSRYPLDLADNTSIPIPCRYVSYAAHYAHYIAGDVKAFRPSLIVCETFSLIGRVVAGLLGVPWINVSPGHNLNPARYVKEIEANALLEVSAECHRAVALLNSEKWVTDATPFSYVTSLSPFLNICCEPPSFLDDTERGVFEPLAFFGSLPDDLHGSSRATRSPEFVHMARIKVYVCFGRIVWRYYKQEAFAALRKISVFLSSSSDFDGLISLGSSALEQSERELIESDNVRVETSVDQKAVLGDADVFVTHHGINSTHEAIVNRVPMLSYPFFWDQPSLAAKCRQMGLALPLSDVVRGPLSVMGVATAMRELQSGAAARSEKLEQARNDELDVIHGRGGVFQRIIELAYRA